MLKKMNFVRGGILSLVVVTIFLSVPNIVFATEPLVESFTLNNRDNSLPEYSDGDTISIKFTIDTDRVGFPLNVPVGMTNVDNLFETEGLGTDFDGQWICDNEFVITVIDSTGHDIQVGEDITDPSAIILIRDAAFPADFWNTSSPILQLFKKTSGGCDGGSSSPELLIEETIAKVIQMINEDKLDEGEATSLIQKLEAAVKKLGDGKDKAAYNMLQSFINQIEAFIKSGVLTSEEGQRLIDSARTVQDDLN